MSDSNEAILIAVYTNVGDARIRNPFGGTPSYNSTMLSDFDRAREEALQFSKASVRNACT